MGDAGMTSFPIPDGSSKSPTSLRGGYQQARQNTCAFNLFYILPVEFFSCKRCSFHRFLIQCITSLAGRDNPKMQKQFRLSDFWKSGWMLTVTSIWCPPTKVQRCTGNTINLPPFLSKCFFLNSLNSILHLSLNFFKMLFFLLKFSEEILPTLVTMKFINLFDALTNPYPQVSQILRALADEGTTSLQESSIQGRRGLYLEDHHRTS